MPIEKFVLSERTGQPSLNCSYKFLEDTRSDRVLILRVGPGDQFGGASEGVPRPHAGLCQEGAALPAVLIRRPDHLNKCIGRIRKRRIVLWQRDRGVRAS
jgi:hypothetical protein